MSFSILPAPGNHFRDPRRIMSGYAEAGDCGMSNQANSFDYFNNANGWTYLNALGTAVDTNYAADTYKDLLNVSGQAGYFGGAVGPTMTTGTDTTTFRITVDGVVYTIAIVGAGTNVRCIIGYSINRALYNTSDASGHGDALASDKMRQIYGAGTSAEAIMMPVQQSLSKGVGLVWFSNSLKVECKTTQAQSNTGSQERQSGVIWRRAY